MRVVYHSFHGRYSDSPRAIFERLRSRSGIEHVWLADPEHRAAFPQGNAIVDIEGPDARATLESADRVIASTHTEVEYDKQPGATYVQTWHGTPLKRVHDDVLWRRRVGWRVRAELGIAEGLTTVLYAPTWRDDDVRRDTTSDVPFALDPAKCATALCPGRVLLARAHSLATGRSRMAEVPGVHDVSYYPDVRDLYAAADVLVTDYSSVMFNYAITGRPIVY